jgi:mycothiol synthase
VTASQLSLRQFRPDDLEDVRRVIAQAESYDRVAPLDEAALLDLVHRGEAVRVVLAQDGFATVRGDALDLVVAPSARRRGLARSLAAAALAGADAPSTAWAHGDLPGTYRLAAHFDFQVARQLLVMRLGPAALLPDLEAPTGVTISTFTPDDTDDLLRVNASAFAQHPEQGRLTRPDFEERAQERWFDPAGLLLARDEAGGLLGFHWTKRHSETDGEVYVVGVSPQAQGRGLGRTLTLAGLHHLRDGGARDIHLYVEADNAPAVKVYQRLGFTVDRRDTHVQYHRRS